MICDRCKHAPNCPAKEMFGGAKRCSGFKRQTNFQRITQSEEVLAEFLDDIPQEIINPLYGVPTKKRALEWLKQESDTE